MPRPDTAPRSAPYADEAALTAACKRRWLAWGGMSLKVHGGASQRRGEPDLLGCCDGRFCAVELKQPGKVPTPLQFKRLRDWAAAGALVGWVTTVAELDDLLGHAADLGWVNPQPLRPAG